MPSETKVTIPWSIPAAVSVKGIVHVPAHNTPMKPGGRETLLIAIAEQDPAHERGATRPPSQSRSPEELSAHLRDRLRGWGDRTRTLMCEEKIHLFDKSPELGFP
jgi:hypothetical protein